LPPYCWTALQREQVSHLIEEISSLEKTLPRGTVLFH
jgi:amino acid transporter